MKKTTRRVFSLVLCVCLIMAMAIPAFAVSDSYQGTYNGQGYVATYSYTTNSFSGSLGSSSTYTLQVCITYDRTDGSAISTGNVTNSLPKQSYTSVSQALSTTLVAIKYQYKMDGNIVYTKNAKP